MAEIKVNNGNIEDALKRFKRQCCMRMNISKKCVRCWINTESST